MIIYLSLCRENGAADRENPLAKAICKIGYSRSAVT
jgi:hypothetical protein